MVKKFGGGAGIRTLDARFSAHTPLAGEPLQPLGHASKPRRYSSMTNCAFLNHFTFLNLSRCSRFQTKSFVQRADGELHVLVFDQDRGFDLTRADHLNIDIFCGQCFKH